jgi:Txe/YoeB family toxin of Txe-Axe toxin-antitoxin module
MEYIETKKAIRDANLIQKSYSKADQNKLLYFVKDILDNPREKNTVGKPEELKDTSIEMWSRRISKKDRIIYGIEPGHEYDMPKEPEIVVFYQYLGHYTDK